MVLQPLKAARERFAALEEWTRAGVATIVEDVAASFGINLGKLGQPIRVAVTGGSVSPPIDVTVWLVGRKRVLERLEAAITGIEERAAASGN